MSDESSQVNGSDSGTGLRVIRYLRPVVAVALLVVLFVLVPPKEIFARLRHVNPGFLALGFVIVFLSIVVSALKLWVLIRTEYKETSYLDVLRAYYVGTFFNNFLPTSVGGDLLKINELRVRGVPVRHAVASVVVERGMGLLVVLMLAVLVPLLQGCLFVDTGLAPLRWPLFGVGVCAFAAFLLGYGLWRVKLKSLLKVRRHGRVFGKAYWAVESFFVFRNHPFEMALAFAISVFFYGLMAAGIVVAAEALGTMVTPVQVIGVVPMATLPEVLPSVGALGVREGALTYCLSQFAPTAVQAAAMALLLRALNWAHSAIGGCVYGLAGRRGGANGSKEA